MQNWLLPEYIHDMLPDEAWQVESMRSAVIELLRRSGYQLVSPPLLEYAESLLIDGEDEKHLTGQPNDRELRTFKLIDQLSGRTLALRADITPQVARIDAHLLNRQSVARLCYAGSVLHTIPAGLNRTRELLQIGAELYGHGGIESDLEIQQLMLQALALVGVENVHLDLGHVGVFSALVSHARIDASLERELFAALQNKDSTTLHDLTAGLDAPSRAAIRVLPTLYGECHEVLGRARHMLPPLPEIVAALHDLQSVADRLNAQSLGIDLADLRGYHYHSGMVFAAYHAGSHDAIAQGGRYDGLGRSFGRARAATGFSMDLRQLYRLLPARPAQPAIRAPYAEDAALSEAIATLRASGEAVVVALPGSAGDPDELQCDRELVLRAGVWQVAVISN
jgi:ATP phosphoribosyltransferase regulatory subunit